MKINGTDYTAPALNVGNVCQLEEWGLQVDNLASRPLGFLAGYVALAIGGKTLEEGEAAIDAHLASGGKLDDITAALNTAISTSGLFNTPAESTAKT